MPDAECVAAGIPGNLRLRIEWGSLFKDLELFPPLVCFPLCRRDRLPAFIRKLIPHRTSARAEYTKYQETQEQCLPNNSIGVGRGAAAT